VDATTSITNLLYTVSGVLAQQQTQNSTCCAELIAALTSLQGAVTAAIAAIPTPAPPTLSIDLTPVGTAIATLGAAIAAANVNEATCCAKIDADLRAIAAALPSSVNLKPISDALVEANKLRDIPQAMLDKLEADGAIPQGYAQFLTGGPHDISDILAKFNDWLGSKLGLGEHISSGTVDLKPAEAKVWNDAVLAFTACYRAIADYYGMPHDSFEHFLSALFAAIVKVEDAAFLPVLEPMIQTLVGQLKPATGTSISLGNIGVNPDTPVATSVGVAFTAHLFAWLASWVKEGTGETMAKIAELVAGAIGFEELRDVVVAPYIRHGIAAVADMQARSLFKQHLPQGSDVAEWMARGLISQSAGKQLLNLDGFGDQIQPSAINAAFMGIRAFQLVRLFQTGLFQDADIADELTFGGMRPASQSRMRAAAPYIATETERKALQSTLINAYVAGLMSDSELTSQVDSIENNYSRDSLILTDARWKKVIRHTQDLEAEYSLLYRAGLLTDASYRSFLSGIGLQSDSVDVIAARVEAQANAALQRKELAQAAALAKATASEERKAAVDGFRAGKINEAALIAALGLTGLTPVQAAAWVTIAELQQVGNLRWVFGLQLNADAAALLRNRVAALVAQREKELITDAQLTAALGALKIPQPQLNAIKAHADALIALSTTAKPVLVPVQTSS
jgi:hypothetical protein